MNAPRKLTFWVAISVENLLSSKKIGIHSQGVNVLTRFSPKTSMISDAVLRSFSFRGSGPSANKESLPVSNYCCRCICMAIYDWSLHLW